MTRARDLANFADDTAGLETLTVSDITDLSVSASNINSATNQITDSSTDLNVDSNTLVVDKSANRVGIGRTDPQTTLDIAHSGSSNSGAVRIGDPSTISSNTSIYMRTTGEAVIGTGGGDIVFDTNIGSAERMRIDHSSGNVGIGGSPTVSHSGYNGSTLNLYQSGTSSAGSSLRFTSHTSGTGSGDGAIVSYWSDNVLYINNQENADTAFYNNGSETMRIKSDGKVGIGTTSPQNHSLLHVKGDMGGEPYCAIVSEETNTSTGYGGFQAKGYLQAHYRYAINGNNKFQTRVGQGTGADKWSVYSWTQSADIFTCDGASGNIGIGETSPVSLLHVAGLLTIKSTQPTLSFDRGGAYAWTLRNGDGSGSFPLSTFNIVNNGGSPVATFLDSGDVLVGKTAHSNTAQGIVLGDDGQIGCVIKDAGAAQQAIFINRQDSDGTLIRFRQANITEGSISVSGSTVSYNGGHLSRWSQLPDNFRDNSLLKGTVMTNLDQMAEWTHDAVEAVEAQDAVFDEEGNLVTEAVQAVEAQDAYTEENEQLNCMAISTVEGDPNVAGVFVNWDEDDDDFHNDMNIAMTGDMVIRIAQGVTVEKGQLLMSAGDGTAKPQGDDIVRNKTIAKVTSNHVSHTYDDGSFCVPCVLMAC